MIVRANQIKFAIAVLSLVVVAGCGDSGSSPSVFSSGGRVGASNAVPTSSVADCAMIVKEEFMTRNGQKFCAAKKAARVALTRL